VLLEAAAVAALASGAASGLHCAAMCGPLAVAGSAGPRGVDRGAAAGYFVGRLAGYAGVGAVLGRLGHHATEIVPFAAVQTIAAAALALVAAARGVAILLARRDPDRLVRLGVRGRSGPTLLARAAAWLPRRGAALGLATALLPCGVLVPAWLLAAGTASAHGGAAVMACFGVASLPGLAVPVVGRGVLERHLARLPAAAHGLAWLALAAWMALRPVLVATGSCH
jgi:hypothetical protein